MEQRALVERAMHGDHEAFGLLVGGAAGRLLGTASLILRDHELAHDATQEALIRAWRDLPSLRDLDRFDAWLHRLTVNACLDLSRRRRRRPIEVEIDGVESGARDDVATDLADRDQLDRALRRLEPEWRAVVVLHYYLGLPMPEVAAILRIPTGTAKSRLNRSMALMRGAIGDDLEPGPGPVQQGQTA